MLFLGLLCCMLSTIYPVFVKGVLDQRCLDNCSCCIDKDCGEMRFPNSCLKGCIDGHRGERCYELCQYENCKSCGGGTLSKICKKCYDGYYLGENNDCKSPCPSNCKSCSSSTMCSKCKEGFYDVNGSTTCPYAYCPGNCECPFGQMDCVSCKNGFYDTSSSCNKTCSKYCEGDMCESMSGFCTSGCKSENRTGNTCNECIIGIYGELCNKMCSKNCRNIRCERYNGNCSEGCIGHFDGTMCDLCIDGKYGENCELDCSVTCAAQKDNKDNEGKTSVILGTLFAMSGIINIVQCVYMLVHKRREALLRETSRQQPDVAHENPMMSSVPPFSKIDETNVVSADKTADYEEIKEDKDADHKYLTISNNVDDEGS